MSESTEQPGSADRVGSSVVKARHDLRNPLGHVMGFGELLLERAKLRGRPDAVKSLQELVVASEQILDEINHCLDPRRIESGQSDLGALRSGVERFCGRVTTLAHQALREMDSEEKVRQDVERIVDSAARMQRVGDASLPPLQAVTTSQAPLQSSATPAEVEKVSTDLSISGRDRIGLSVEPGKVRDRLVQVMDGAGYCVEILDPADCTPTTVAPLALDVLVVELDLRRPEHIGFLECLKDQTATNRLAIIVLNRSPAAVEHSALKADDILRWPPQTELLLARMGCILAVKRLHDQERVLLGRIATIQQRADQLMGGLLPSSIVTRIRSGHRVIADLYNEATVVSADFGGLSRWAAAFPPETIISGLTEVFSAYDDLCRSRSLPVGRIVGDSYQVVTGVPEADVDHVERAAELALLWQREALPLRLAGGRLLRARVGLHTGPVSAGVLGGSRLSFEIWGEPVELARLLRAQAPPGTILTTSTTAAFLRGRYVFEDAPSVRLEESGVLETKVLLGKVP